MRFELTAESQAAFKRGLAATAKRLNKSILDLLRQTVVYYAQAARKRTPGPRYGAGQSVAKLRPVVPIPAEDRGKIKTPKGKVALYFVEAYIGPVGQRKFVRWPTRSRGNIIRYIRYSGAAQVSWNAMLQQVFGRSSMNDIKHFPHVDSIGSIARIYSPKTFHMAIDTENKLGYIAKLRPGIVNDALIIAENRFANGYINKIGKDLEAEFNK